ncbi:unnamed protein product [Brassicogethes aeneus]|uniref:Uncharacterized protein n=1 Tax=Brassicogethes aeneus TaxID=1431903 RepID=A0A9P0FEP4_BRAAE|nr:unnamed protein product [Brassicogethes aeneus]
MSNKKIRITVVGDGDTGKTSILIAYKDKTFNDTYTPTVFDSYSMDIPIFNEIYHIILYDTAGQEDFDRLRRFAYKDTDVFILCYAINNPDSYYNIKDKWVPELRALKPNTKIILTGTKSDLKRMSGSITTEEGQTLAKQIKADGFLECSAKNMINIEQTFQTAFLRAVKVDRKNKQKGHCVML